MADSTVRIGADISEIRRELSKLPNLSTEAAQKTLIQIEKAVQKAEKSAKRSAKAIRASQRKTAKALDSEIKKLGEQAGDTDSILKALGGAIGLISPEAEKALSGIGDLSGGVEAVTKTSTHLGLAIKSVLAIAGPVTVAIAALGAAYLHLKGELDDSIDKQKTQRTILEELGPLIDKVSAAQLNLAVATGAVSAGEAKLIQVRKQANELFVSSTKTLQEEIAKTKERIEAEESTVRSSAVAKKQAAERIAELNTKLASQTRQLELARIAASRIVTAEEGIQEAAAKAKTELEEERKAQEALTRARDIAADRAAAVAKIQDVIISGLSDTEQAMVHLLQEMADLSDLQERFPGLSGQVAEALAILQAEMTALTAETSETVDEVQTLAESIEAMVPRQTRLDKLNELLLAARSALALMGEASGVTADDIARLEAEIAKLMPEVEDLDPDEPRRFWEVFTAGATAATAAAAGVAGAVSGSIDMFDRFLQLAGGFSLADLAAVAAEGGDVGAIVEEMVKAGTETVRVFVESLPLVIDAFLDGLPSIISEFIKAIDPVVKAIGAAVPEVLGFVVAALPGLADTVADLLTSGLFDKVIAALPSVIEALLDLAPDLITAALAAVGDVVSALIAEIPGATLAIIEALPAILQAVSEGLIDLGDEVAEALIMELVLKSPELVAALVEALVIDLPVALAEGFIENIRGFFADLLTELQPGSQTTASFGDTPGAVVAPMAGLTARFAPGDTVIAAQDPQEALRQAQQAAGVSSSPQTVTLDLRDGHIAFDRMFRTNIRAGGSLSTLNTSPTGRVKVYG